MPQFVIHMKYDCTYNLQRRIANSDEDAFRELFDRYFDRVMQFMYGFTHDRSIAEDLTQELFIKLWCHRELLPGIQSLNAYVYRAARNITINALRTQGRSVSLTKIIDPKESVLPDDLYYALEKQLLIDLTVEQLPERPRQIFRMSRIEGLSNEEIARRLEITVKTVENHLNIALKRIRYALQNCNIFI